MNSRSPLHLSNRFYFFSFYRLSLSFIHGQFFPIARLITPSREINVFPIRWYIIAVFRKKHASFLFNNDLMLTIYGNYWPGTRMRNLLEQRCPFPQSSSDVPQWFRALRSSRLYFIGASNFEFSLLRHVSDGADSS